MWQKWNTDNTDEMDSHRFIHWGRRFLSVEKIFRCSAPPIPFNSFDTTNVTGATHLLLEVPGGLMVFRCRATEYL